MARMSSMSHETEALHPMPFPMHLQEHRCRHHSRRHRWRTPIRIPSPFHHPQGSPPSRSGAFSFHPASSLHPCPGMEALPLLRALSRPSGFPTERMRTLRLPTDMDPSMRLRPKAGSGPRALSSFFVRTASSCLGTMSPGHVPCSPTGPGRGPDV